MNNGIIVKNGSIGVAQVVSGNENSVEMNQSDVKIKENVEKTEDMESIKRSLIDLNSNLSEHKHLIDELSKKVSIMEAEFEEQSPNKEKIKRYLNDTFSMIERASITMKSILDVGQIFK